MKKLIKKLINGRLNLKNLKNEDQKDKEIIYYINNINYSKIKEYYVYF